eukprot:ANDGO_06806.mRNA.1 Protein disulfide-isomerase
MIRPTFAVLLVAALVSLSLATDIPTEEHVLVLDGSNFDAAIAEHSFVAVEFYAPWCGHCKKLAPEWAKAATTLDAEGSPIKLAKVDADTHKELASRFGVQGYPTIKIFRGSDVATDFKGPRDADGIVKYVKKQVEPSMTSFASAAEAQAFVDARRADKVIVAYGAKASELLNKASNALRDLFALGSIASASEDSIVAYRDFDQTEVKFDFAQNADAVDTDVVAWAKSLVLPLIGELNGQTAEQYVNRGLPLGVLFLDYSAFGGQAPSAAEVKNIPAIQALWASAQKYGHKQIVFCYLDNARFGQHQKRLGLPGTTPAFGIDDLHHDQRFPFLNAELTAENVGKFVEEFAEGKMEAFMRSEEIPANEDPSHVFVLVGKSFVQEVFDSNRDVLVEFYAPWCGHCKQLAPIYDDLAARFAPVADRIRVAKMDATVNDAPKPIKVQGYPTLYFFKKGSKEPINFSGERTLEGMSKFLLENNSAGVKESDLAAVESAAEETKDEL